MSAEIVCFRCGESLASLTLPFSRRDLCPGCSVHVHVCRMCDCFDPGVPGQCREDDAEEVHDKERANFCDWFRPSENAFDPARAKQQARAESELEALFGDADNAETETDAKYQDAEDLFK